MQIENIAIGELIPYANNPRHNDSAVQYVAESIRQFGFKVPILIDKNNVIVSGHTRLKAATRLGMTVVPCIRADDLSDEQIRAFRIADNKVAEKATWDMAKLADEIAEIDIDMSVFGLELDEITDTDSEFDTDDDFGGYYGDERERTNRAYHLDLIDHDALTNDFWQMPTIKRTHFVPENLIGFNYAMSSHEKNAGIHFYVDDYQFERVWNYPEKYIDVLSEYDCILTPDFSLYMDMPMPMKIWNVYRSRQIGAYYQQMGITVIPTVSWAEAETFEFCFRGLQTGGTVSISTVGVKEDKSALLVWKNGVNAMIEAIQPQTILIYGGKLDYDYGDIQTVYYENRVTENWKKG